MKKLEEITSQETIEWLLEEENPSVRYFTLTRLLNKAENDTDVLTAKQNIMTSGLVPKILNQQNEDGSWGDKKRFYTDKYSGTVWQLIILAELGATVENNQIRRAGDFILDYSQDAESFGFSMKKAGRTSGGLHSEVIPCLTGNMVCSLIKIGMIEDIRVQQGIEWILKYQRSDDGIAEEPTDWPYDRNNVCWGKHTCHMGVVKSLKALSAIPEALRNKEINDKIKVLAEYMLVHHIHKKSHNLKSNSKPGWLKLGFPLMYQTDILEILGILTELGYNDPRMREALEILQSKQDKDGRWKLENTFNGKMIEDIESKGQHSKWITLKALGVLVRT